MFVHLSPTLTPSCSKYGLRWFRKWEIFLAWASIIANQGSATCYQLTTHKNLNTFNRRQFWDRPLAVKAKCD